MIASSAYTKSRGGRFLFVNCLIAMSRCLLSRGTTKHCLSFWFVAAAKNTNGREIALHLAEVMLWLWVMGDGLWLWVVGCGGRGRVLGVAGGPGSDLTISCPIFFQFRPAGFWLFLAFLSFGK
jgi:hypothetical protein